MTIQDLNGHTAAPVGAEASLYRKVALRISELIEHGTLRPGERVPSVRKCSEQQNVSIATVTQAYRLLEDRAVVAAHAYEVPPGNRALRVQVARRAMEAGCTLAPDDIVTTVGVTEAMNLCLRAVAKPGDVIAIESPTFFNILQIIESLGMRVCEIPTFPREGICLDELEKRLKCCKVKACVFTPNFSNPLGSCMPDQKKRSLVEL